MFDTPGAGFGGTGTKFNWEMLGSLSGDLPFMLSGGIGPEDVETLRELSHPGLFAVDVNSRFESRPGMKDVELLRRFIHGIRR